MKDLCESFANAVKKAVKSIRDWLIHLFGGKTAKEYSDLEEDLSKLRAKLELREKIISDERRRLHGFKASANTLLLSASDRKSITKCIEVFKKQIFEDLGEQMSRYIGVDIVNNEFVATVFVYDPRGAEITIKPEDFHETIPNLD